MRGQILFATLCAFLTVAGGASATSPLPAKEVTFAPMPTDVALVRSEFEEKREIEEVCVGREVACFGPYTPWIHYYWGATGVRVRTDDTNVTGGHDPARHQRYGPYVFPMLLEDDLRVCWGGCSLPDSLYARARTNATLHVYVLSQEVVVSRHISANATTLYPTAVPRSWCEWAQYTRC